MHLIDIIRREPVPEPWSEGEKIPWDDPAFSQRMLKEHLSDVHDAASRRASVIDRHVDWIHSHVLGGTSSRILDLGCGPGLYLHRLTRLGHTCTGIDFSPASISYARETATAESLNCQFHHADVREADYGKGYGLAMMIFGELNVFRQGDARKILRKSRQALAPGGSLLIEVHTPEAVQAIGGAAPRWRSSEHGLFSDRPHLLLEESFWEPDRKAATTRYLVIDAESGDVDRYAASMQAYSEANYREMLTETGFRVTNVVSALDGASDPTDFLVFVATVE
jgi:SAM-dependent methyltransferase